MTFFALTQVRLAAALLAELTRRTPAESILGYRAAAEQLEAIPTFPLIIPDTSE
jgi:hypothetical protein